MPLSHCSLNVDNRGWMTPQSENGSRRSMARIFRILVWRQIITNVHSAILSKIADRGINMAS